MHRVFVTPGPIPPGRLGPSSCFPYLTRTNCGLISVCPTAIALQRASGIQTRYNYLQIYLQSAAVPSKRRSDRCIGDGVWPRHRRDVWTAALLPAYPTVSMPLRYPLSAPVAVVTQQPLTLEALSARVGPQQATLLALDHEQVQAIPGCDNAVFGDG